MIVDAGKGASERLLRRRIASLEEANQVLRDRNAWLETELYGRRWACPPELGLTRSEMAIMSALVTNADCSVELLHRAMARPGREPETDPKIVQVFVCRMRPKLEAFGIRIETVIRVGYRLEKTARRRLLAWPSDDLFSGRSAA
jgi:two-component system, cell cycle response regulator CtrA